MSALTNFAKTMFTRARSVIGGEALTVGGGTAVSAVMAEADQSRELEDGGYDRSESLTAVVDLTEWVAAYTLPDSAYLGKTATARGITYRVSGMNRGQGFVRVTLAATRKGA